MPFSTLRRARPTLRSAMRAGRHRAYHCIELTRDSFRVVASPKLVGNRGHQPLSPAELAKFPLIEIEWPSTDLMRRIGNAGRRWRAAASSACPTSRGCKA